MSPEKLICRACGSDSLRKLGECAAFPKGCESDGPLPAAGSFWCCRACGLGQRHPVPDEETLAAIYRDTPARSMDYVFEDNVAWAESRRMLMRRFDSDRGDLTVLDIGCHTGAFLDGLPMRWRRYGVESATAPISIAEQRHGVRIIAERLEDIGKEWERCFDIVTMFDVIEHLPDPASGIAAAAKLLKPNGLLLISSADLGAWTWRWLGSRHWYLQTPQHLCVLSGRFLRDAAERNSIQLKEFQRIPHRRGSLRVRIREAMELLYWGLKQRGGVFRVPQRLLHAMPGLSDLRHMQRVPWTMRLADHFLVIYEN